MRFDDDPVRPGSQSALRSANQRRVVDLLKTVGEVTQARLARETGLAPATVSNIVRELTEAGVLDSVDTGKRGRLLRFTRAAGLAVGIDIGDRRVTVAVADMSHAILAQRRESLDRGAGAPAGLAVAAALLDDSLAELDADREQLVGIGLGVPGPIPDVAAAATDAFGRPVSVENVANLGALAEFRWGAGRGGNSVVHLTLSEAIGVGMILDGKLFRGRDGTAGEIGHSVVDEFGALCRCGNRGCLETVVATWALVDLLTPVHGAGLGVDDVLRLAAAGDPACVRALGDTGRRVGPAVASLCNLLNPDRIVIGGDLALAGEPLLEPLREVVRRFALPSATRDLSLVPAALGARATVLGAVALALDEPAATVAEVS